MSVVADFPKLVNVQLGWVPGFAPLIVPALGGSDFFACFQRYIVEGISTIGLKE